MLLLVAVGLFSSPVQAELVLSQLIIDLGETKDRDDIEIWNNSNERAYVAAEPREVIDAGKATEHHNVEPDPAKRGLLVSPARLILEPGQRKLVRIAALGPRPDRERVYRLTIKPVVGEFSSEETGLKLLIGYDVLVLLRPTRSSPNLSAHRGVNSVSFTNAGNASLELADGKQCRPGGKDCIDLPGKRLYAGATWFVPVKSNDPVEYTIISGGKSVRQRF